MATSGSIDLVYTRDDIIQEALEQLGAVEVGATPEAVLVTSAARTLNMMVKAWQTTGLEIHSVARRYLFAEPNQRAYTLTASGDRWVDSYVRDTLVADAAAGASSVTVSDGSQFSALTDVGIYLDDGTMHWDTITSVVSDTINLTTGNIAADASTGSVVYGYDATSDRAGRPMEIVEAWERDWQENDRPLDLVSRNEYAELTLKENTGGVVSVFYDPQVVTPQLFIWPIHEDLRMILGTWVKRTIEDFDAAGNDADYPQEAYLALAFNLAHLMIGKMRVPPNTAAMITQQAGIWYENYMDYAARPEANVEFEPFDTVGWDEGDKQP